MKTSKDGVSRERAIIDAAMKRLKRAADSDVHNRTAAIEDLKFANGEQWDEGEKSRRGNKGRPALQINLLPKYIDQVVGDMLHNSPSIKVRPEDSQADIQVAKIRQGLIADIEYRSNSKAIYGYGAKQMVTSGYGAWRVLTRYTEDNPFLQEIYEEAIRNPFLVFMDPTAKDQNYADAKWGFVLEKMPLEDFQERWPAAKYPSSASIASEIGLGAENWYDGDTITVAEYFSIEDEKKTLIQLEDGRVVDEAGLAKLQEEWDAKNLALRQDLAMSVPASLKPQASPSGAPTPDGMAPAEGPPGPQTSGPPPTEGAGLPQGPSAGAPPAPPQAPAQLDPAIMAKAQSLGKRPEAINRKDTKVPVVRHRTITCLEIIDGGVEGKRFPGKFIPIVLLKGRELNIEGKNFVYSLIRNAKDPQKLVNYWNSSAAEIIALAPKAPWLGTPKNFEGYENDYATANVENYPFLKYNPDPDAPGPPQRQTAGPPPVAIFEQIRRAEENVKSTLGMFNADVGAPGSEQTGAAITARQRPGDIGTFEFTENWNRAILHTGRIINEMIPEVYDSERDIRMRHLDETESFVPVNTTVGAAAGAVKKDPERYAGLDPKRLGKMQSSDGSDARLNDLTTGRYGVVITTGPSYATQRQESAQHLMQLASAMPEKMGLAADLIVQNLDFKDADELAERLRKTLPAGMARLRPGEAPPPPQPPPPEAIAAQAAVQMAQIKLEQEKIKLEMERAKVQMEMLRMQKEMRDTSDGNSFDRNSEVVGLMLEKDRLDLEKAKFRHQSDIDVDRLAHERLRAEEKYFSDLAKQAGVGPNNA